MRWQFNTPIASHLKRWWETIEEARARWVEKWVKWVKVSPEVAKGVEQTEDLIPYILNNWDLNKILPELEILPIITSKKPLNKILPIIEDLTPKNKFLHLFTDPPSDTRDWSDKSLWEELAKMLWLPSDITWWEFVSWVWKRAENKSRRTTELKDLEYPFVGKDWKLYYSHEALAQANDDYNRRFIQFKAKDWTYHPDMEWVRRADEAWYKSMMDLGLKYDYKYPLKPEKEFLISLNPETDKLAPNPNLNPEIDKSQPFPDHDIPIVNKPNSDLGKSND